MIVLDPEGEFVCTVRSVGEQLGELRGPLTVAVNSDRDVVVYEMSNYRLQLFHH